VPIEAVIFLSAVTPAIDIVIAHDLEELHEFSRSGLRLRGDFIASGGYRPGRILAMENFEELTQCLNHARMRLIGNLIASGPEYDTWMIPVTMHKIDHVILMPFIEIQRITVRVCGDAESLRIRVFTRTVAAASEICGVVTNVPHCATCTGFVTVSQV
jgi:hypothetical protein